MKPLLTTIVLLVAVLCLAVVAEAQISCFTYAGGMVSCNTPNGITRQQPLGPTGGVFTDEQGNVTPYNVMPYNPPSQRPLYDTLPKLPTVPDYRTPYGRQAPSPWESTPSPSPLFLPGFGGETGQ